jgi:pseudo-response regulator 5
VFYAALANNKTKKSTSQKKVLKNTETLEAGRDCNVMGEVVISSGEELEVRSKSEREKEKQRKQSKEETGEVKKKKKKKKEGEGLNDGLVRWDGFLPRMVLRVLLVEADDSTRQIIAALLRKCSYRGKLLDLVSQTGSIAVFLLIL